MRRLEQLGIVLGVVLLVALPTVLHGWPSTARGNVFVGLLLCSGFALVWWRSRPRVAAVLSLGLVLAAASVGGGWLPDTSMAIYSSAFAVLALGWSGRAAWLVGACAVAFLVPMGYLTDLTDVAALMFTVPPFAAGTVLRLRRETAADLAITAQELEEERELFAQIALRHERARIASELHDIVGHAISVMVIQSAAGQRLVGVDPARANQAFAAISESARQGTADLQRLIELLGGEGSDAAAVTDLSLIEEVVARAGRSGLSVICRFEGDRTRVSAPVAHLAFRVVQESLTNALKHAPGAEVRILIQVDEPGPGLVVRVENDRCAREPESLSGTGRGLIGLRERVQALGGQFAAGGTAIGGWAVVARFPHHPAPSTRQ